MFFRQSVTSEFAISGIGFSFNICVIVYIKRFEKKKDKV